MASFTSSDKLYYHWTNGWSDGIAIGTSKANGYAAKPNNGLAKTGRTILDFSITPSSSKTITSLSLNLGAVKQGTATKTYTIKGHLYAFGSTSNKLTINSSVSAQDHTIAFSGKTSYYVGAATTSVTTNNQGKNFTLTWTNLNWSSDKYVQVWLECVSGTAADDDGNELEIWTYKNTSDPTLMQTASYSIVEENSISPLNIYYDLFNTDINSIVVDSTSNYYVNTNDYKRIYNKTSETIYTEQINKLSTTSKHTVKDLNDFGISRPGYSCLSYLTSQGKSVSPGDQLSASGFIGEGSTASTTYLTAQWTPQIYKIILDQHFNSGTKQTYYLKYGVGWYSDSQCATSSLSKITQTIPTGYSLRGYFTESGGNGIKIIDSNLSFLSNTFTTTDETTLHAKWDPNIYKITLNRQSDSGGHSEVYLKYNTGWYSNATATTSTTSITAPTRTNYDFGGYYTKENGEGTQIIDSDGNIIAGKTAFSADTTLYAHWITNITTYTYTITFNGNNNTTGSLPADLKATGTSSSVTMGRLGSAVPTRTGYNFRGWSSTSNYSNKRIAYSNSSSHGGGADYNGTSPTAAEEAWTFKKYCECTGIVTTGTTLTLYAQWELKKYAITYYKNAGNTTEIFLEEYKNHGTTTTYYITTEAPTREGYQFLGWSTNSTDTTPMDKYTAGKSYSTNGALKLYAVWEKVITTEYIITFDINGGSGNVPIDIKATGTSTSVVMGEDIGQAVPSKDGYTFRGWSSTPEYSSTRIAYSAFLGGAADNNGQTALTTQSYWTFQNYCTNTGIDDSRTTLTLYAQWEPNQYTVTFDPNGGALSADLRSKSVTYNSNYGVLPTPTRTGYSFNGWYTQTTNGTKITSSTIVSTANNHTLYAHWQANQYTVTYNGNGATSGSMSDSTFNYGTSYNLPTNNFQKQYTVDFYSDGTKYYSDTQIYDFVYWTNTTTGNLYSNKESIINLTSQNNGTVELTATWMPNGKITLPDGPTKDDESFMGWKNNSTNEILQPGVQYQATTNTTFTAEWQNKESVMISYYANGTTGLKQESKYIGDEYEIQPVPSTFYKNFTVYFRVEKDGVTSSYGPYTISREFSHWNTKSNGSGVTYYPGEEILIAEELKLYAIWEYAVIESDKVPEIDTISGYRFDGWYSDTNYSNKVTFPYTQSTERTGINFYGQYISENDNIITYYLNDGTDTSFYSQTKTYNDSINIYNGIPARQNGEKRVGNLNFSKLDGVWRDGTTTSTKSIDLYAIIEFTFKNWNTERDGSGTVYQAGDPYSNNSDLTLYAQWTSLTKSERKEITLPEIYKPSETSSYTITLDSDGSKTPLEASYEIQYPFNGWTNHSETITIPADQTTYTHINNGVLDTFYPLFMESGGIAEYVLPTEETYNKPGYRLLGWSRTKNGNVNFEPGDTFITGSDQTLYTRWEPLGLVHIRVDNEWKYAIPYIYDGTGWRQAIAHIYEKKTSDSSEYEWKVSI